jgi:glycosyltransferase involved in cell wall biosynthesis
VAYPYPFASSGERPSIPVDTPLPRLSRARLLGAARRRLGGRRLAVVDTHFPWQISGFRYQECLEIHALRPDTLFFSLHELTDPFPARIHPLSSFPRVSARAGITDVYLVFLNLAIAFLGLGRHPAAAEIEGIPRVSLRRVIDAMGLRVHVQLYPGGGLLPSVPPAILRAVAGRCATVFTNVSEVERAVPSATFVPMLVGTDAYPFRPRRPADELRLVFVGDNRPRKGLATLIDAFNRLPDGFRLDIVGPNEAHLPRLTNPRHQAHGWLGPRELLELYRDCDVFVSPSTVEVEDELAMGMIDGFPTTAAAEAMSSGCALVSSNPRGEFRALRPGKEYVDVPDRDADALVRVLEELKEDREWLARLAERGAARVREFSTEVVVATKLAEMGLSTSDAGSQPTSMGPANGSLLPVETRQRIKAVLATLPTDVGGGSSLTKALVVGDLIVRHDVRALVEIGVYRGRFLLPAAVVLRDLERGPAIGIDPYGAKDAAQSDLATDRPDLAEAVDEWASSLDWDGLHRDVLAAIEEFELDAVCVLDRRTSAEAAADLDPRSIDLVHIDGNHDRRQVERDLALYLPKVRPGGLVVMDDLSWAGVSAAVATRSDQLELVHRAYTPGVDDFGVYRLR